MSYSLFTESPVKWTATQEKSIGGEFPFDLSNESSQEGVSRVYLQFLWLPESIMPLKLFTAAILRASRTQSSSCGHQIYQLLSPLLLAPRESSQKYTKMIPQMLVNDDAQYSAEETMMWYAVRHEKIGVDEDKADEAEQEAAEEQWRREWLSRMERREAMIQILMHLLLLSRPDTSDTNTREISPEPVSFTSYDPTSPRKRRKTERERQRSIPVSALEDQVEIYMDKLSMWQLMGSLDRIPGVEGPQSNSLVQSATKNKDGTTDERDWMQKFCEDIVEPLFKQTLSDHCSLLRTKVFQSSAFVDGSDPLSPLSTPPSSPKQKSKRLKSSTSTAKLDDGQRELSRSRSLSVSLEEERRRERSRSISIGPQNIHKRALAREVSMSTNFKGKAKVPAKPEPEKKVIERRRPETIAKKGKGKSVGKTLVAATPQKPKVKIEFRTRLPAAPLGQSDSLPTISQGSAVLRAVEGDGNDDEWMLSSSPDILLLSADRSHRQVGSFRVLAEATPTKKTTTDRIR